MNWENVPHMAKNAPSVTSSIITLQCAKATKGRARVRQSSNLMIMMKIAQTMVISKRYPKENSSISIR